MCGIAGFAGHRTGDAEGTIRGMTDCLRHRGPDSDGVWLDADAGLALGHRRLAIVDLSPAGAQPMTSASGRWIIVLNGEIYNYRALRDELAARGHSFRGSSDTEVLLAAIEEWGVDRAIARCAGMFAAAVWDVRDRQLYLFRDRLGEKPLYVAQMNGVLLFGSELRSLRRHPSWRGVVSGAGLSDLMRFGYVSTGLCIYEGVRKVVPGTIQVYQVVGDGEAMLLRETAYWSAREVMSGGARERRHESVEVLVQELDDLLSAVVREQMVADVPLGAFLSGGIDSSLIVALMQRQGGAAVRTFSIGFDIKDYDEAPHARLVAQHLGTEHTEHYVTAAEAMGVIGRLPEIYDEPFADSSQIPTFLVSQLARSAVTVSLSGDGGDEIFGGYNRYAWMERVWRFMERTPMWARRSGAAAVTSVSPERWDGVGGLVGRIVPSLQLRTYGDKVHKLARLLTMPSREACYGEIISAWPAPRTVLAPAYSPGDGGRTVEWPGGAMTFTEEMMLADMVGYLPNDILVKVDRAAMAVSLETRAPFIDHRVVEFAARLPFHVKVNEGVTKWILRELLYRYVPRVLVERPKMGFGVPLHAWLRTDLRDWAEDLLDARRLGAEGYFDAAVVQAVWRAHLDGRINGVPKLWPILMFQSWLAQQPA